jgi:hypothetical protein
LTLLARCQLVQKFGGGPDRGKFRSVVFARDRLQAVTETLRKKRANLAPSTRLARKMVTGTRVPEKHSLPCMISGSIFNTCATPLGAANALRLAVQSRL